MSRTTKTVLDELSRVQRQIEMVRAALRLRRRKVIQAIIKELEAELAERIAHRDRLEKELPNAKQWHRDPKFEPHMIGRTMQEASF